MQKRLHEALNGQEDNYILPFYWQHGEDADLLIEGMERIRECGIRAVCVEARPHPDYVGKLWWRDMDIILSKAKELGMKVWVLDDSHFPTGRCNNKITENSPYRIIVLTHYSIDAIGPMKASSFIVNLEKNETFVGAVAARRDKNRNYYLEDVQDITECYHGDVIEWDIPEGFWSITIIKTTDKHTGRQGYANLIDRDAVRFFLDTVYEPHYKHYGKDFGDTFAGFFSDEPQLGNTCKDIPDPSESYAGVPTIPLPWCQELEEQLHELWGEKYCINLVALWNDIDDDQRVTNRSGRIRKDYTELVTRLYQKNFCEQIGDWCREHGAEYIGHIIEGSRLGTGVGHFFRGLWGQDMAGIDVVLQATRPQLDDTQFHRFNGKLSKGSEFSHYGLGKLGSSLGHIDSKKKGRALCEIFGAYGWTEGVKLMKWLVDHMLVRGINYYVPHAFTMKDFPDPDCPPHFYARGNNPQFPYFKLLMEYLNRISHLLNGGVHCANVGILYTADLEWMERNIMQFSIPAKELTQNQVDFDIIPIDVVMASKIENGMLLSGASVYEEGKEIGREKISTLIIPECRYFDRKFANWCMKAITEGLKIVCVNSIPAIVEEDGKLAQWSSIHPEVIPLESLGKRLRGIGAGLNLSVTDSYLRYYNYFHADGEYYLFFNESVTNKITTEVKLQAGEGKGVVEYNAWKNQLEDAAWDPENKKLLLELMPYEMKILYVGSMEEKRVHKQADKGGNRMELNTVWKLYLKKTCEAEFSFDRELHTLDNITAHSMYPSFCGTMRYVAEVELDKGMDWVYIDFGDVYETAQLWINDVPAGIQITPPYQFDVKGLLKEGRNKIVLEVTNTLVHQVRDRFSKVMPVEPSGLLGPVSLIATS